MEKKKKEQLAIIEYDRLRERRDQNGKVQDDRVPAKATPYNWPEKLSIFTS